MSIPLEELTLVRCSPAQARIAVLNDPPAKKVDEALLLARAEDEPDDAATWALVPRSDTHTLDLLSHCVTYRRQALVSSGSAEPSPAIAYGLAAVFTPPKNRGKGYARRMAQLLHYVLAAEMPPFPAEWGAPPSVQGFKDATFNFLHSGIDGAFYTKCTQGIGEGSRPGWIPKPPHTRLWTVPPSNSNSPPPPLQPGYELLDVDGVATLQVEYEGILRSQLASVSSPTFAVIPDLSALRRLGPPSILPTHFGVRLPTGWFTYLQLRPSLKKPWRITLSHVSGDVPFSAVTDAARRERATVIEYGGEGFTAWDGEGVEIDKEWPRPCVCVYGGQRFEWVGPEMLIIEGVGTPGHWAWY